jgi:cysteine desulfurase
MIYLDNAATTKPNKNCLEKSEKYLYDCYYNPSALYAGGYNLHLEIKSAREKIIDCIADKDKFDLIFTSCGTEADNQAIFCGGKRGNVVTTSGEHSAIFSSANELKQRGVEVRFADLNSDGSVNVDSLLSLVDAKTSLVSVIHVNNETGAINDINKIAKLIKAKNKTTLFHSDGVQAFGKIPVRLSGDIDMYSVSAHKIGGLKGTGALFKQKKLQLKPYIYGGGQESGLRSGTENVFGIKVFEFAALNKYDSIKENYLKVQKLNNLMWQLLDKSLFTKISADNASPYILTVGVEGVRGETILHEADDAGVIVGTGSACSSNEKKRHSRVMLACNVSDSLLDGILRISFSSDNSEEEIISAAEILNKIVKHRKEIMS